MSETATKEIGFTISREAAYNIAMSMYMDDECMYCHRNFTKEELKGAVWAYPNRFGRIVHKECWDANND